jgi:hypothetical protein
MTGRFISAARRLQDKCSYTLVEDHADHFVVRVSPPIRGKKAYPMLYDRSTNRPFFQIPTAELGLPLLPNVRVIGDRVDHSTKPPTILLTIAKGITLQ